MRSRPLGHGGPVFNVRMYKFCTQHAKTVAVCYFHLLKHVLLFFLKIWRRQYGSAPKHSDDKHKQSRYIQQRRWNEELRMERLEGVSFWSVSPVCGYLQVTSFPVRHTYLSKINKYQCTIIRAHNTGRYLMYQTSWVLNIKCGIFRTCRLFVDSKHILIIHLNWIIKTNGDYHTQNVEMCLFYNWLFKLIICTKTYRIWVEMVWTLMKYHRTKQLQTFYAVDIRIYQPSQPSASVNIALLGW